MMREFVRVNYSNSDSSLPNVRAAEERYLVPIIGQEQYDLLIAPGMQDERLLYYCRAVVAPLAYLSDLAFIQSQITDAGIHTLDTDNQKASHRWEYLELKDGLADMGALAQEALLRYLFTKKTDYPQWVESHEYKQFTGLVVSTGYEFSTYFNLHQPHRIFWHLRPLIKKVQDITIIPLIGATFLKSLLSLNAPSEIEAEALRLLKSATAQLTIVMACREMAVRIGEHGFTVLMAAGNVEHVMHSNQQATDSQIAELRNSLDVSGKDYLLKLQELLNGAASPSVFPEYYSSKYYRDPNKPEGTSPNEELRLFSMF